MMKPDKRTIFDILVNNSDGDPFKVGSESLKRALRDIGINEVNDLRDYAYFDIVNKLDTSLINELIYNISQNKSIFT